LERKKELPTLGRHHQVDKDSGIVRGQTKIGDLST